MTRKPLFADLIAAHEGLAEELKAVDVAADLTLLLDHAGKSRAELARELGWSRARVTQVMSGHGNLTVQTIATIAKALGFTFDVVFREPKTAAAAQPWSRQGPLLLPSLNFADFAREIPPEARNVPTREKAKKKKSAARPVRT